MLSYLIFTTIPLLFAFYRWRNWQGEIKYLVQSQNQALSGSTGLKTTQYKITPLTVEDRLGGSMTGDRKIRSDCSDDTGKSGKRGLNAEH